MEESYVLQSSEKKFKNLHLCFCGYCKCDPLYSFGPAVRPNYIIYYILEGKGIYKAGGKIYELTAGEGFLIEPEEVVFHQADSIEPWSYLWIGFAGEAAEDYLKCIGLNDDNLVFRTSKASELEAIVKKMIENGTSSMADQFCREGLLYEFFGILAKDMEVKKKEDENKYVNRAIEYIQNNYFNPVKISDIAEYVRINRSYLYVLFRRTLGISPQEYLTNCRFARARDLLLLTDLSVEGVAYSCGYVDAMVFSKMFKQKNGTTPSKFRKNSRK